LTTIGFPGATFTGAAGINQAGDVIVGRYTDAGNITHGYWLNGGQFRPFDPPDSIYTLAVRINSDGDIVGYYQSADNTFHAFLLHDGSFATIDPPGAEQAGDQTGLIGINDSGDIAGYYSDGSVTHGFLLSGGNYTTIDFPGAVHTWCTAINNAGCIVGAYQDVAGNIHGFRLQRE
jgi:probable HAF family extracellular repeat protein